MCWILNREVSVSAPYHIQMCRGLASLVCKPRPRTIPAGVTHHLPSAPHQGSWSSSSTNLDWWDPKRRASSCPVSADTTALQPMLQPKAKQTDMRINEVGKRCGSWWPTQPDLTGKCYYFTRWWWFCVNSYNVNHTNLYYTTRVSSL